MLAILRAIVHAYALDIAYIETRAAMLPWLAIVVASIVTIAIVSPNVRKV